MPFYLSEYGNSFFWFIQLLALYFLTMTLSGKVSPGECSPVPFFKKPCKISITFMPSKTFIFLLISFKWRTENVWAGENSNSVVLTINHMFNWWRWRRGILISISSEKGHPVASVHPQLIDELYLGQIERILNTTLVSEISTGFESGPQEFIAVWPWTRQLKLFVPSPFPPPTLVGCRMIIVIIPTLQDC